MSPTPPVSRVHPPITPFCCFSQDGENSPPGGANQVNGGSPNTHGGLTPGGVGSPSKKQTRNTPSTPKSKASALPSKSKKKRSPSKQQQQAASSYSLTAAAIDAASAAREREEGAQGRVSSEKQAVGPREGFGVGLSELRESGGSGKTAGEGGGKSKVVIAVSRRVSVLRVSTAGGRRWVMGLLGWSLCVAQLWRTLVYDVIVLGVCFMRFT